MNRRARGFTLLEVIVVLAIGAVLYAVVLSGPFGKASAADLKSAARTLASGVAFLQRLLHAGGGEPRLRDHQRARLLVEERGAREPGGEDLEGDREDEREEHERDHHLDQREAGGASRGGPIHRCARAR